MTTAPQLPSRNPGGDVKGTVWGLQSTGWGEHVEGRKKPQEEKPFLFRNGSMSCTRNRGQQEDLDALCILASLHRALAEFAPRKRPRRLCVKSRKPHWRPPRIVPWKRGPACSKTRMKPFCKQHISVSSMKRRCCRISLFCRVHLASVT